MISFMYKLYLEFRKNWLLFVALIIVVLLRIPSLFEPQLYADEDIYLTIGMGIRHGQMLYINLFDNKPPLIYLMAAVAGSVFWFRLILSVWNLLNVTLIYELAENLFEGKKTWSGFTAIVFGILSSIPLFEGNIVNSEVLMIMPITAAWLLIIRSLKNNDKGCLAWLWAGFLSGVAILFKVPSLIDWMGIAFMSLLLSTKDLRRWVWKIGMSWVGLVIPVLVFVIYFWSKGGLQLMFKSTFLDLFPYLVSWSGGKTASTGLGSRVLLLMIWCGVLIIARGKLRPYGLAALTWFGFSLFAATLSGRPYPHYLMQIVPSLSLIIVLFVYGSLTEVRLSTAVMFCLGITWMGFKFWVYPTMSYYERFVLFATGRLTRQEYASETESKSVWYYKLIENIRRISAPGDQIFVWGTEPAIYFLSNRLPATRYVVSYHIIDARAYDKVVRELEEKLPKLIVVMKEEERFEGLIKLLSTNYMPIDRIGEAQLFIRIGKEMKGI